MKKDYLILGAITSLVALGVLYKLSVSDEVETRVESAVAPTIESQKISSVSPGPGSGQEIRTKGAKGLFSHLPQSRKGMPLESDPFTAESVEEQQWLDRNGYPNAEQWVAYSSASDGMLSQAAADGDSIAAVFLDSRALANGDRDALNRLLRAGQTGSSFALSMLQAYLAGSSKGDPALAYSISRVIELKGDVRAGLARDFSPTASRLTPEQKIKAEADALSLFARMKKTAKKQPFVDPRPYLTNSERGSL